MTETALPAPPGYESLVPFDKETHSNLGIRSDRRFAFSASLHAVHLSVIEFAQAARHYPIVFSNSNDDSAIMPMVVTGLKSEENVFVKEDGSWSDGVYIPAYLRRYPFYTAKLEGGKETDEHMICVDPAGLSKDDPPLIDKEGKTSERWDQLQNFIRDMEIARNTSTIFTAKLKEHDLLESFEAQIHGKSNDDYRLHGMTRVSDEKLKALPAKVLQEFVKNDYLFLIHLHRLSLDNFRLLLDRASAGTNTS